MKKEKLTTKIKKYLKESGISFALGTITTFIALNTIGAYSTVYLQKQMGIDYKTAATVNYLGSNLSGPSPIDISQIPFLYAHKDIYDDHNYRNTAEQNLQKIRNNLKFPSLKKQ